MKIITDDGDGFKESNIDLAELDRYMNLTQDEKYAEYKKWCAERGFKGDEPYEYFR